MMEFGLIAQWVQLGFGGVVSVILVYLITIYNPKRDKEHIKGIESLRLEFTETLDKTHDRYQEQMDAYRTQHVQAELDAHAHIIEMCKDQHQAFIDHDNQMRSGMQQIIYAILLLNPDISPAERQKITDKLMES